MVGEASGAPPNGAGQRYRGWIAVRGRLWYRRTGEQRVRASSSPDAMKLDSWRPESVGSRAPDASNTEANKTFRPGVMAVRITTEPSLAQRGTPGIPDHLGVTVRNSTNTGNP